MLKGNCINPQLACVLANTGHTDYLAVVDAGFPVPLHVERVDLAWAEGKPGWLEVCELIKSQMVIEKIYLAEDIQTKSPGMCARFLEMFQGYDIEFIAHAQIKSWARDTRAVIRTGEYTSFSNCIFVAGVNFQPEVP